MSTNQHKYAQRNAKIVTSQHGKIIPYSGQIKLVVKRLQYQSCVSVSVRITLHLSVSESWQ